MEARTKTNTEASIETSLKQKITQAWDHGAAGYDAQYAHGLHGERAKMAWLDAFRRYVGRGPFAGDIALDVLDVGTGTGFAALLLAELGHRVRGYDLSSAMMAEARRKAGEADLSASFAVGDAERLPLADDTADALVSRHVFWTLPDPVAALREWQRVVKPGGKIVVIDGLWGVPQTALQKAQAQLGRFLVSLVVPPSPARGHDYAPEVRATLPAMKFQNSAQIQAMFEAAGLTHVTLAGLPDVDRAEHADMPFAYRIQHTTPHYIITGIVP